MFGRDHKYHDSHIVIDSQLASEKVLGIAREMALIHQSVFTDSEVSDIEEGMFVSRLDTYLGYKHLKFSVRVEPAMPGCRLITEILEYTMTQDRYMHFIPISFWVMNGYRVYRKYMKELAETITAADPTCKHIITERKV